MTNLYDSGRNLTVDNWYMFYQLSQDLIKKKINVVGTIRKNKRELPLEFFAAKKRGVHTSVFGFQKTNHYCVVCAGKKIMCCTFIYYAL